jgi:hypothetical protein
MPDLTGPRMKLRWAQRHLETLVSEWDTFLKVLLDNPTKLTQSTTDPVGAVAGTKPAENACDG